MENIDYSSSILWLATWPILIYATYRFIVLNIGHFEEFINTK